jgi:predicted transposase YdaD
MKLWTATYLLLGLLFSEELVSTLLEGAANMQESTTYQAILREGRTEGRTEGLIEGRQEGLIEGRITGEQQHLVRQGTEEFGKPDLAIQTAIEAIRDLERLEVLSVRIIDPSVRDWNELLRTS